MAPGLQQPRQQQLRLRRRPCALSLGRRAATAPKCAVVRCDQQARQPPAGGVPSAGDALAPLATVLQAAGRVAACTGLATSLALSGTPLPAAAVLSSPNVLIPRSAEVVLRRSIPAFNSDVRGIQSRLEGIQSKLRIPSRKPWGAMREDAQAAAAAAADGGAMLAGVPPADEAAGGAVGGPVRQQLAKLEAAIAAKDAGRTSVRVANALERVGRLELLQAPGLPYQLPRQVMGRPVLTGRAMVEVVLETGDGRKAFTAPDSAAGPQSRTTLRLMLDGFSAPVTAGNFAANVADRLYDGAALQVTSVAVLAGEAGGPGAAARGPAPPPLPLETFSQGDFEPSYRLPLDVAGGERPRLPLSIFGALAMAHLPGDAAGSSGLVSGSQWFVYLFNRQDAGLAGLDFAEGEYGVMGYATQGLQALREVKDGDRIVSARLVEGADKLGRPAAAPALLDGAVATAPGGGAQ